MPSAVKVALRASGAGVRGGVRPGRRESVRFQGYKTSGIFIVFGPTRSKGGRLAIQVLNRCGEPVPARLLPYGSRLCNTLHTVPFNTEPRAHRKTPPRLDPSLFSYTGDHATQSIFGSRSGLAAGAAAAPPAQFRKSICSGIFPPETPLADEFRLAKGAGFEGIEIRYGEQVKVDSTADDLKRLRDAAASAGVTIAAAGSPGPLSSNPLNSPDPATRARGVQAIEQATGFAAALGGGAMLIVPGRLGDTGKLKIGYQDTWDRVTAEFRKAVPRAAEAKVCLTPENVWEEFLVSPLEMRSFIDQFQSPWVQAHFDIGNVMQFGYPEDWILTLGPRIRRIHVKDYKLSTRAEQGRFVDLLTGDVDWKGVMAALVKVGYRGFMFPPEVGHKADVPDQLKKVSVALDKILAMA